MDVTVGLLGIAAIEIIGIDPGVARGLAELDLSFPDLNPVVIGLPAAGIVVNAADDKVEIVSFEILFELIDEFVKAFFVCLGESVIRV